MLIFLDSNFAVKYVSVSTINQGSIAANKIKVIAPITASAVLSLAFTLPNGEVLPADHLAEGESLNLVLDESAQEHLQDFTVNGQALNIWSYTLDRVLTEMSGTLGVQIFAAINEAIFATASVNVPVYRGTGFLMPVDPPENSEQYWSDVLQALNSANTAATNAVNTANDAEDTANDAFELSELLNTLVSNLNNTVYGTGTLSGLVDDVRELELLGIKKQIISGDGWLVLGPPTYDPLNPDDPWRDVSYMGAIIEENLEVYKDIDTGGDINATGDISSSRHILAKKVIGSPDEDFETASDAVLYADGDAVVDGELYAETATVGTDITVGNSVTAKNADIENADIENVSAQNVTAQNLTVMGTTTTVNQETLAVKDNVIIANSEGVELTTGYSGLAIETGEIAADGNPRAYGIVYDHYDEVAKVGFGRISEGANGEKEFIVHNASNLTAIATRRTMTEGSIPVWNNNAAAFVDSNKNPDDFLLSQQPLECPPAFAEPVYNNKYPFSVYGVDAFGRQGLMGATHKPIGNTLVRRDTLGYIYAKAPSSDVHVTNKKYVDDADSVLENEIEVLDTKVKNLEGLLLDFTEDSSVAYRKSVPANAAPYASIEKIGGMTYRRKKVVESIVPLTTSTIDMVSDSDGTYWGSWVLYDDANNPITFKAGKLYELNTTMSYNGAYVSAVYIDRDYTKYFNGAPTEDYTTDYIDIAEIIYDTSGSGQTPIEGDTFPLEISAELVEYTYVLEDTKVTALESMGANLAPSQEYGVYIPCVLKANTQYTVSVANPASDNLSLLFYDENKTRISNVLVNLEDANTDRRYATFILPQDCSYIMWAWASVTTVNEGQIQYGSIPSAYKPYTTEPIDTFAIPVEAIEAKVNGYGAGKDSNIYNYIEWRDDKVWFVQTCEKDENTLTVNQLAEPIETDISDILSSYNFIKVEGGGTIEAVNEAGNENAVPTTIEFVTKL